MDLTTQHGLTVIPVIAYYDHDTGAFVGADCQRLDDGQLRYYAVHQLRHPDGAMGVQCALESAQSKLAEAQHN